MARIMIIDDDLEHAENLSVFLEGKGHTVNTIDQTEGAIAVLAELKPDLLVLDVMFPENPVAGFDLARTIRRTKAIRELRILMLTGVNQEFPMDFSADDIDRDWLPVHDFVDKTTDLDEIASRVEALLAD